MKIRLENENDYCDVEKMVRNAFWNVYRPGAYEHYIVHKLRNHPTFIKDLAYVIDEGGEIAGHINYSNGKIICGNDMEDAPVLGPVAIDEKYQNQGYGTKLIEFTLKIAKDKGIPYVFVVGDENYYSRFGFESASKYNYYLEETSTSDENPFFMIKIFDKSKISRERGIFRNPDVFDVDEMDVDEFDKNFEYNEKLVLEGQLGV